MSVVAGMKDVRFFSILTTNGIRDIQIFLHGKIYLSTPLQKKESKFALWVIYYALHLFGPEDNIACCRPTYAPTWSNMASGQIYPPQRNMLWCEQIWTAGNYALTDWRLIKICYKSYKKCTYSKLKALKRTNISNLFFYCCFQLLKSYKNKTNTIKIISRDNFKIKASEYVNYSRKFNTYLKEEVNLLINLSKTAQPTSPTFSYEIMM